MKFFWQINKTHLEELTKITKNTKFVLIDFKTESFGKSFIIVQQMFEKIFQFEDNLFGPILIFIYKTQEKKQNFILQIKTER